MGRIRKVASAAAFAAAVSCAATAQQYRFDVPPQELKFALRAITREAGFQLFASANDLRGRMSTEIHADTTLEDALRQLLAGTDLHAEINGTAVFIRGRGEGEAAPVLSVSSEILVTGTRIKGAPPSFPITTITQAEIQDRGLNDLGEVIRTLPQNFNGGQNPGVTFGVPGSENVTSGSSLNLRGLGPDATLTLLNGHRIAYDSANQSVDVSAIPVAALDRLEIVPDGASALYGSDAVGGVANVILRRDYSGLDTSLRIGSTTDGGGFEQEYGAVTGGRWAGGGLIATAKFARTAQITASDRGITSDLPGDTTLNPSQRVESFLAAAHQSLSPAIEVLIDGFYTHRTSSATSSFALPDVLAYGTTFHSDLASYAIAPKIDWQLGSTWHAELQGVHSGDKVDTRTVLYFGGAALETVPVSYANTLDSVDGNLEGAVFHLPGGAVRLAAGGGFRSVGLHGINRTIIEGVDASSTDFRGRRHTSFGYGELYVPVVGSANAMPAIRRIDLTLAGRLEHDPEYGSVFTPKIGIGYDPSRDIGFNASWGRSFKEPTLYQLSSPETVVLGPTAEFANGYPDTATVLVRNNGNPKLRPERALTWSATLNFHPVAVPGLHVAASYFSIRYQNRIVTPLQVESGVLANPLYADIVTLNPGAAAAEAVVAAAQGGFTNETGSAFDPANVVAIVDNRYRNLSRFAARGVDVAVSARIRLPDGSAVEPSGSASWLDSSQIDLPGTDAIARAGTIYNPPHWRARFDAPWTKSAVTVSPAVNFTGGVTDNLDPGDVHVRGMVTVDLTIRYVAPQDARLKGLNVTFSVLNIGNRMPGRIPVSDFFYPPYDSTNFQATGRYVGLSVGKHW